MEENRGGRRNKAKQVTLQRMLGITCPMQGCQVKEVEHRGQFWGKWGELPVAQTRAAPGSAFGQPEELWSPAVAVLVGAGEAGSPARWWGWAVGGDVCGRIVTGKGESREQEETKARGRVDGMCHYSSTHLRALTMKADVVKYCCYVGT